MAKISELVIDVQTKLANRSDVPARAPFWIRDSLREIVDSYPFTELQEFGPVVQLTAGERAYQCDFFTRDNCWPNIIDVMELFIDYPSNSITTVIFWREPGVVLPASRIQAIPGMFTRVGKQFIFASCPDQNYSLQMTYQHKHPFAGADLEGLNASEIFIPDSWLEIVTLSAAWRGAMELRLPDYVSLYYTMLHGDPENPTQPGMLKARVAQHQRDKQSSYGRVVPVVPRA